MLGSVPVHPDSSSVDSLILLSSGIVLRSTSKFLLFGGFLESIIIILEMPLQTSLSKFGEVHVKAILVC